MELDRTRIDADTLRYLRELTKDNWFREPLTCEGRKMCRGMDGYFTQVEGQEGVTLTRDRDPWNVLLWLIGE